MRHGSAPVVFPLLLVLLLLAGLARPGALAAQDASPEPEPGAAAQQDAESARRARRAFETGLAHFEARRYRDAIHEFHVAAQLVPSADLWFNIARAHEELGEWEPAIEHYRRYLRDRVDPPDREQVEALVALLEERAEAARAARLTRPTTGTVTVRVDVEGATVRIGERDVGTSPVTDELTLDPGRHPLLVTRDGYLPFRSEIAVEPGLRTAAYIDLQPETRYRAIAGDRIFTWISFGLAAASAGVAIGLGVEAGSRQGTDLDSAREWGAWSDAAIGGAIGFAALGLVLWFVEGRAVGTETITTAE